MQELSASQSALLTYIQREQLRSGKRLVHQRDIPVDIGLTSTVLKQALHEAGFDVSETEAIGTLQELVALKTGVKIRKSDLYRVEGAPPVPIFIIRYSHPAKLRVKLWREEQKRLGRTVRTYYLTDAEQAKVQRFIEELRSELK